MPLPHIILHQNVLFTFRFFDCYTVVLVSFLIFFLLFFHYKEILKSLPTKKLLEKKKENHQRPATKLDTINTGIVCVNQNKNRDLGLGGRKKTLLLLRGSRPVPSRPNWRNGKRESHREKKNTSRAGVYYCVAHRSHDNDKNCVAVSQLIVENNACGSERYIAFYNAYCLYEKRFENN